MLTFLFGHKIIHFSTKVTLYFQQIKFKKMQHKFNQAKEKVKCKFNSDIGLWLWNSVRQNLRKILKPLE